MTFTPQPPVRVAIGCGGTEGFISRPGSGRRACAAWLRGDVAYFAQGCGSASGARRLSGVEVIALPAVGLKRGGEIAFLRGFIRSYRVAARLFKRARRRLPLAMGGFTQRAADSGGEEGWGMDVPSRIEHYPRPR